MSNMSYCRFENTLGDLQDCWDAIEDDLDVKEMSETETEALVDMYWTCQSFVESFKKNGIMDKINSREENEEDEEEQRKENLCANGRCNGAHFLLPHGASWNLTIIKFVI